MQAGFSSGVVSPWWPFLWLLRVLHREYDCHERRIEGDLAFLFRWTCGFRYLETDLLPPERECWVWKEWCLTKGNKAFCKCTDMVESSKKVKICHVQCFGCFLAKGCCWTRLFQLIWFLLSTGMSQLPQEWRSTKVIWFASSPTILNQMRIRSAAAIKILWHAVGKKSQTTQHHSHRESRLLLVALPIFPSRALMNAIQHQH